MKELILTKEMYIDFIKDLMCKVNAYTYYKITFNLKPSVVQ
jgi:hypothetical protein